MYADEQVGKVYNRRRHIDFFLAADALQSIVLSFARPIQSIRLPMTIWSSAIGNRPLRVLWSRDGHVTPNGRGHDPQSLRFDISDTVQLQDTGLALMHHLYETRCYRSAGLVVT